MIPGWYCGVLKHLFRMKAHEGNAIQVAKFLETHKNVKKVFYPGLKSHPQHDLACSQQYGFGGMVSFEVKGGIDEVNHILRSVKYLCCCRIPWRN